jgi:hypothetical protein
MSDQDSLYTFPLVSLSVYKDILCKDYPKTTEQTHNPIFTLLSFISNTIGSSLKPLKPTVEIAWSEKSL